MTKMHPGGILSACSAGLAAVWMLAMLSGPTPAYALGADTDTTTQSCAAGEVFNEECKACAKVCEEGTVWDCSTKACVQKSSRNWSDETLYLQAVSLIKGGYYREGRDLLWSIKKREQPKVLNYIGYTTRKLGNLERGIEYYHKALALDPNYSKAREYLGEGYLQRDDVESAKAQLLEIAKRCGRDCAEYEALADAIAIHLSGEKLIKTW
jgi:tetratricopeptide (TPR) repeat protein